MSWIAAITAPQLDRGTRRATSSDSELIANSADIPIEPVVVQAVEAERDHP